MKTGICTVGMIFLSLVSMQLAAIPVDIDGAPELVDSKSKQEYILYKSALKKFSAGDMDGARQAFLASLKANPIFFPSMIGMAEIEYSAGNKEEAKAYFDRAFAVSKDSAILHTAYGKYLFKSNDVPGAKKAFEMALNINPRQADAHAELAVIYLSRLGDTGKAIRHYTHASEIRPDDISILYGLSAALSAGGRVDESVVTLKKISDRLPDNAIPWQLMGVYYARAGRFGEAISALKISTKKDPRFIDARWILADTYLQAGKHKDALAEYQWMADNTDHKAVAYYKKGLVYHVNKDYVKAEKAYLQSIKFNPALSDAYNNLAYISIETGKNYTAGLDWANKAVKMKPDSSIYLDTLGWLYFKTGEYQKARKYLQLAVNSKPASAEANYHLGKVYEKLNESHLAEKYFTEAKRIDKNYTPMN